MKYLGDFAINKPLNFKFSTQKLDGSPFALVGGVVTIYKDNVADSESTEGVTFTANFDSLTGSNNLYIDMQASGFYTAGHDYAAILTAGTVNSLSVVGTVLCQWSIQNRSTPDVSGLSTASGVTQVSTDLGTLANTVNQLGGKLNTIESELVSATGTIDSSIRQSEYNTALNISQLSSDTLISLDNVNHSLLVIGSDITAVSDNVDIVIQNQQLDLETLRSDISQSTSDLNSNITQSKVDILNATDDIYADIQFIKAKDPVTGTGSTPTTLVIKTPAGVPVYQAEVWITGDTDGEDNGTLEAGTVYTDRAGKVYFMLNPAWYWIHYVKDGEQNYTTARFEVTI